MQYCKNTNKCKERRLKLIKQFSLSELEQLFFEDEYITHLDQVAHPDLSRFKQRLMMSIEFYNDKLNRKLFEYLFPGKIRSLDFCLILLLFLFQFFR